MYSSESSRWNAIQSKDVNADGAFFYAVKSTRIYCRPVCKARLPRRGNVQFFETCQAAQDAGYRACKRCKPEGTGVMPLEQGTERVRQLLYEMTTQKAAGPGGPSRRRELTLAEMAARSGLSKWHFHRVFKKLAGVTPQKFLEMQNQRDMTQMQRPDLTVSSSSGSPSTEISEMGTPLPVMLESNSLFEPLPMLSAAPGLPFDHLAQTYDTNDSPVFADWPQLADILFNPEIAETDFACIQFDDFCDF